MEKKDLYTGESFIPKRVNQKFATPQNRIDYYNNKANELRKETAKINKPLHQNLRILNQLMEGKKEAIFHKEFLLGKGYNFEVFTNVNAHKAKLVFGLYDYSLMQIENDRIKIIRK